MVSAEALAQRHCEPCDASTPPLTEEQAELFLRRLPEWRQRDGLIERTFRFKNYYRTMAFVNAVAWIAHWENHHPDMHVTYNTCTVSYTTHAIGGLSENDFICAAKVDDLFKEHAA